MSPRERFIWGCFGSFLPEILRLYNIVTHEQSLPRFTWPYLIISLLFVLSAGLFTIAWEADSRFKGVWVGASFPTLVSTLLKAAPTLPTTSFVLLDRFF
jgi:hypothetical protein